MKVEYINPFITSIISVFDTMLGTSLTRGELFLKNSHAPEHEVSAIIGLSGKAKGTVVLSLSRETAIHITEAFLEERPTEINADVTDAIGELTNMIAGGAKAQFEQLELSISLPNVITGKGHTIDFPRGKSPICIPFDCEWGGIVMEVVLIEQPAEVLAGARG